MNVREFERHAQLMLSKNAFDYYASGANDMVTLRENRREELLIVLSAMAWRADHGMSHRRTSRSFHGISYRDMLFQSRHILPTVTETMLYCYI